MNFKKFLIEEKLWWAKPSPTQGEYLGTLLRGAYAKITTVDYKTHDVMVIGPEILSWTALHCKVNGDTRAFVDFKIHNIVKLDIEPSSKKTVVKNLLQQVKEFKQDLGLLPREIPAIKRILKKIKMDLDPEIKKILSYLESQI